MKKRIVYALLILSASILAGIGVYKFLNKETVNTPSKTDTYTFIHNNMNFVMGSDFSEKMYGKANNYSEIQSCAFEGLDKTFTYDNYEVYTFPDGDKDKILSVYFLNEQVKTTEGISLGSTYQDMIKIYGAYDKKVENQYIYLSGNTSLKVIVENDIIISIEYAYEYQ